MTTSKVALSLPSEAVRRAKREVASGKAKSLSAFVGEAVQEKLAHDDLARVLDETDAEYGKPDRKARAWAERVLSR